MVIATRSQARTAILESLWMGPLQQTSRVFFCQVGGSYSLTPSTTPSAFLVTTDSLSLIADSSQPSKTQRSTRRLLSGGLTQTVRRLLGTLGSSQKCPSRQVFCWPV